MRSLAGLALSLALLAGPPGGCSSGPRGMLDPVTPTIATDRVDMLAATTRDPSPDDGILFTGDRGPGVAYASLEVSIPPHTPVGTVQWPKNRPGNPATDFVVTRSQRLTPAEVSPWFAARPGAKRRVFVYVHGFNTTFERAVFRFAQLAHDSDANAVPVLFSWPSRGRLFDYRRDLDNATYARSDLADLLEKAAANPNIGEVVVLAHSMGGWVAMEALRDLALRHGRVPDKVSNVILASPDLDVGIFRRQVEEMGAKRPTITVFVSRKDRALRLSAFLASGQTRLGAVDPADPAFWATLEGLRDVTVIDLSELRAGNRINHAVYAASPEVVQLIGDRLVEGQIITDEDISPVGALGTAAERLITAPIRVFYLAQ